MGNGSRTAAAPALERRCRCEDTVKEKVQSAPDHLPRRRSTLAPTSILLTGQPCRQDEKGRHIFQTSFLLL